MSASARVVVVVGPVSGNLDLVLRREGLMVIETRPSATVYGPSAPPVFAGRSA